jgi:hypothetical protein
VIILAEAKFLRGWINQPPVWRLGLGFGIRLSYFNGTSPFEKASARVPEEREA